MFAKYQYNTRIRVRKYMVLYIPTKEYKYLVITECDILFT